MPHSDPETVWTVVVAGGSGTRFGHPKQYDVLGDSRVIDRAVDVARQATSGVIVVVPEADLVAESNTGDRVVAGGSTRSESVRRGLAALPDDVAIVCVHDAARPFASPELFAAVVAEVVRGADGAIPGIPVTDTIKVVDASGFVVATPDRASLVAVQTPQAFRADVLRRAHDATTDGTDDAVLVEAVGGRVVVVAGEATNRKITWPDDLDWARAHAASLIGARFAAESSASR